MSTIDIRTVKEDITKIIVGGDISIRPRALGQLGWYFVISGDDAEIYVDFTDIENLYKAMKKARELWGGDKSA